MCRGVFTARRKIIYIYIYKICVLHSVVTHGHLMLQKESVMEGSYTRLHGRFSTQTV